MARAWSEQRPPFRGLHLDSAAAGRCSTETTRAVCDHVRREAEAGAYVAEEDAEPVLATGRDAAGGAARGAPGRARVRGERDGRARHPVVGVAAPCRGHRHGVDQRVGPALATFAAHGLRITELPARSDGILDLDRLGPALAEDLPALVHLIHVASHRPLVQPVAEAATGCRDAGVPLWADAAQAFGHVDTVTGAADAVYPTSRKWLTGPRGVRLLGVAESCWDRLRQSRKVTDQPWWPVRTGSDKPVTRVSSDAGHGTLDAWPRPVSAVGSPRSASSPGSPRRSSPPVRTSRPA